MAMSVKCFEEKNYARSGYHGEVGAWYRGMAEDAEGMMAKISGGEPSVVS